MVPCVVSAVKSGAVSFSRRDIPTFYASLRVVAFNNSGANEPVKLGKLAVEIRVAFLEELVLMAGAHPAARAFSVAGVEFVHYVHAADHLAEDIKPVTVLPFHRVVGHDVNLRDASVRRSHRKAEPTARVAGAF